jgi:hypothetical protein
MPRYTILIPLITSIWTWHEDGSRCDIREPSFQKQETTGNVVYPSISSRGLYFGNPHINKCR